MQPSQCSNDAVESATLANGLVVLVERMPFVESAAFCLLIPAGAVFEPPGKNGTAALLADLLFRGAGAYSNRDLFAALDRLGVDRDESVFPYHLALSGACLATNLADVLRLYGQILQRPHLPEEQFEAAVSGLAQALMGQEDDPQKKVMIELRRRTYPDPLGRPTDGDLEELSNVTHADVVEHFQKHVHPDRAILGIAGNVTFAEILPVVEQVFSTWTSGTATEIVAHSRGNLSGHLMQESTQTHIGVAYPAVSYAHPDYYASWAAVSVLSGGMSSRLFTEVREKRGLCYSVYATLHSLKDQGRVLCYAGTSAERAQETLDVLVGELRRLADGIEAPELQRCKAIAKSSLIMALESTSSRAGSIARDWYHLGRVTPLQEVRDRIEALTPDSVLETVRRHPVENLTVLTIGPHPLETPRAVSRDAT